MATHLGRPPSFLHKDPPQSPWSHSRSLFSRCPTCMAGSLEEIDVPKRDCQSAAQGCFTTHGLQIRALPLIWLIVSIFTVQWDRVVLFRLGRGCYLHQCNLSQAFLMWGLLISHSATDFQTILLARPLYYFYVLLYFQKTLFLLYVYFLGALVF